MTVRRREQAYPFRAATSLAADTGAALMAEAERSGRSLASVLREAVTRGLKPMQEARRKQRTRKRTPQRT